MRIETISLEVTCYGCGTRFDIDKWKEVQDINHFKPTGGLYTSPINSKHSWKKWCIDNEFNTEALREELTISFQGRAIIVNSYEDLIKLPRRDTYPSCRTWLNFELIKDRADAFYLTEQGEIDTKFSNPSLYGWDCETLYIMNYSSIYVEEDHFNELPDDFRSIHG